MKNNFKKNYRDIGTSVILYPDNYINDIEGEKIEEMCEDFLKKGFKTIIIDFSGTEIINSIGVSILIGIIERVRLNKGIVFFSGLKKINQEIFSIVGLTKHIQVFNTEEEAVTSAKDTASQMMM
ncbi:MAG: STAS domain-containing protein [Deltaproteobacteria bacterium]